MTPQELRNSILQLAIQGKLVEQRPEEGTAEELYRQIQEEKEHLIKTGVIKKEKPLPEITADEKPFDIPDSWKWMRITDCGAFMSGYTPHSNQLVSAGKTPYFKVSDMNTQGNELFLTMTSSYMKDSNVRKRFLKNTIVFPKNGGAVFTNKKRILSQDSVVDLNTGGYYPYKPTSLMFAYYYFSTIDFKQCWKGTALPTIDMDKLQRKWFPVPPLTEQKRIVAKIEELLPYINRYEQAWNRLEDFNKRFPEDMKKSILRHAIQGKLVEQRPEEGTAEELYQQIQAEKQQLIKTGKTKKEKPLPEITEEEKPFDIPDNWRWVRLRNIATLYNGRAYKQQELLSSGKYPVLRVGNLFTSDKWYYSNLELEDEKYCSEGDLIYAWSASFGPHIWHGDKAIYHYHIWKVDYSKLICREFLYYLLLTDTANIKKSGHGLAMIHITKEGTEKRCIPLPPLAEQKRIVAKLEELLPLCEQLK